MSILADYHMHSNYSGDSDATMESMVQSAISKGLTHICFTDHIDFEYPYQETDTPGMFEFNADAYVYEAVRLKEKYANQININIGVEIGLQPHLARKNAIFAKGHDYDFIIGSTHVCDGEDPYYPKFWENRTEEEAIRSFFKCTLDNIKAFGNYNVYGHLDYIVRYCKTKNQNFSYDQYKDLIDEILERLIDHEIGIECNTKGYASSLNAPNPCFDILKRYHDLGGEIITVGSDAHKPEDIAASFDLAKEVLEKAGFRYYTIFDGRMPQYLKL